MDDGAETDRGGSLADQTGSEHTASADAPIPPGVLNLDYLIDNFGSLGGVIRQMIEAHAEALPSTRTKLATMMATGERESAFELAHAAAGASKSVGAMQLGDLFDHVSEAVVSHDEIPADDLLADLDDAILAFRTAVQALFAPAQSED